MELINSNMPPFVYREVLRTKAYKASGSRNLCCLVSYGTDKVDEVSVRAPEIPLILHAE